MSRQNNGVSTALQYGGMIVRVAGWQVSLLIAAAIGVIFLIAPVVLLFHNEPDVGGAISQQGTQQIPPNLLPIYQAAAKKYNVPWNLLAAINKVETDFGRDLRTSYTGARGWMQFEPCTWVGWGPFCDRHGNLTKPIDITNLENIKKYHGYGVDGNGDGKADPNDPWDAIFSTANYLARNGAAKGQIEESVFAYNHDPLYVSKVLRYAQTFVQAPQTNQVVAGKGQFVFPVPSPYVGKITSPFGMRFHPIKHIYLMHAGTDFGVPQGTPVFAAAGGKVVYAGYMGGYGNVVIIDHGNGLQTRYGHLSQSLVSIGQKVSAGQQIARSGSTGESTGPHLHFEVRINDRAVDPMGFLKR